MDMIACVAAGVARVCGCEKPAVKGCSGGSCAYNPNYKKGTGDFARDHQASALTMNDDRLKK